MGLKVVVVAHSASSSRGLKGTAVEVDRASRARSLNVCDPRRTVVIRACALLDVLENAHRVVHSALLNYHWSATPDRRECAIPQDISPSSIAGPAWRAAHGLRNSGNGGVWQRNWAPRTRSPTPSRPGVVGNPATVAAERCSRTCTGQSFHPQGASRRNPRRASFADGRSRKLKSRRFRPRSRCV